MKYLAFLAAAVIAAAPAAVVAADPHAGHGSAGAAKTTPADGAMVMGSPAAFAITLPHPMKLEALELKGPGGVVSVAIPAGGPSTKISVPLPKLAPGNYVATWRAVGADGHKTSGVVRFMVH